MAQTYTPRVAIACQGGGSHTAFTAGLLRRLLGPQLRDRFEPIALSGTSGGAMCAALVWAGLAGGGPDEAIARLTGFWSDLEAHDLFDATANAWGLWLARSPVTAELSPYVYAPTARTRLEALLRQHLALERIDAAARRSGPRLFVGATDIVEGLRVVFEGDTLGYEDLIASAAIPPLFQAVAAHGTLFWDGLFTTNPPVREFTDLHPRPDEIWVVQIDPQRREEEPRTTGAIADRRNELAGNLSLGQELHFIDKINELLRDHAPLARRYRPIRIRVVELSIQGLDYPSKFDRSGPFIEALMRHGEERAAWFFDERSCWPRAGTPPCRPAFPARGAARPA